MILLLVLRYSPKVTASARLANPCQACQIQISGKELSPGGLWDIFTKGGAWLAYQAVRAGKNLKATGQDNQSMLNRSLWEYGRLGPKNLSNCLLSLVL